MAILKLKKFLNFYGSHPENFDQETKEWISSTPTDKLRRDLQNYRAAVGVDFYNMDLGGAVESIPGVSVSIAEDRAGQAALKALTGFYLKYIGGPISMLDKNGVEKQSTGFLEAADIANILIYEPQPVYRAIIDKAMAGEVLTEGEIEHINQALAGGGVYQQYSEEKKRHILRRRVYFGHFGIIKALYEFVYDISCQRVEIGRCELEGCDNIFVFGGSGSKQKYCSPYHRVRAHQLRQREMAESHADVTVHEI